MPCRAEREDPPHDVGLGLVDPPLDVAVDLHVVVAEHAAAGDVPGLRFADHRLARPLPDLAAELGVHFRAHEAGDVGGEVPILEGRAVLIEPDGHARLRDGFQFAEGFVAVTSAEPRGVAHDEHLERRRPCGSRATAAGG